ncbi:a-factor receptor [Tulasnella sp. 427]|nr:a-factor receptor [Tulasnella sp. 427]
MSSLTALPSTNSIDPTYPTFPVFAALGMVFISLPAYWHFKSRNVGTILFITWTFLGNLNGFVNSIAWAGNTHTPPWFWCDLSTALIVAINVAIPTSTLLITHRLYSISTIRQVTISKAESLRSKYIELAVGLGIPILGVILHVIVQGHRFDIYENFGCYPATYVTPVTVPTVYLPPILINLVSCVYAALAIRAFLKQRKQFSQILASSNSGLSVSRYFRLMALASTEICFSLPTSVWLLALNVSSGFFPWISWEDTHFNFNRFEVVPWGFWETNHRAYILVNLSRYTLPACSFFFFAYLGLSGESGRFYHRQFWNVASKLGFRAPSEKSAGASWIGRPGASAGSQFRSMPQGTTTGTITYTTKKETFSMSDYPSTVGSQASSSYESLVLPPGLDDKAPSSKKGPSAEVGSSVV